MVVLTAVMATQAAVMVANVVVVTTQTTFIFLVYG